MTVSVNLVKVEYDAFGTDLKSTHTPKATVHFVVCQEGLSPFSFTFDIADFETLDAAVVQAQRLLVDFAKNLQAAASAPLVGKTGHP